MVRPSSSAFAAVLLLLPVGSGLAAPAAPSSAHEVGEDYQVDYARAKVTSLQILAPPGWRVEVFEGVSAVAHGAAPLNYRPTKAGAVLVTLRLPAGATWETQVAVRAGMRAVLRAWPGRTRTQVSVVEAPAAPARALADDAFTALVDRLSQTAGPKRYQALVSAAPDARFSISQAGELIDQFRDGKDKLKVLAWVHRRLVDPDEAIGLAGRFPVLADRRRAQDLVTVHR